MKIYECGSKGVNVINGKIIFQQEKVCIRLPNRIMFIRNRYHYNSIRIIAANGYHVQHMIRYV